MKAVGAQVARRAVPLRLRRHRVLEHALCLKLLPDRLRLPSVPASALAPRSDELPVTVRALPEGGWASALNDVVVLTRLALASGARRVLELGSYTGTTARVLAEHLPDGSRVVAVDIDPSHGSAYAGTAAADRIERRVGAISPELFDDDPDHSFDLVFIDADHRYPAVRDDTRTVQRLVAPDGLLAWHDYANWGWFDRASGVPEFLTDLSRTLPLVHVAGTALVVHRPSWCGDERGAYDALVAGA